MPIFSDIPRSPTGPNPFGMPFGQGEIDEKGNMQKMHIANSD